MTDDEGGFTLAEALMALLIVSLALAGLMQASKVLGRTDHRQQETAKQEIARKSFEGEIKAALLPLQPIIGDDIQGDAQALQYACAQGGCSLNAPAGTFVYLSGGRAHAAWPPSVAPGTLPQQLEALVWRDTDGKNLAVVKFPVEHARDCLFDMISRTCLEPEFASSAP